MKRKNNGNRPNIDYFYALITIMYLLIWFVTVIIKGNLAP